MHLLSLASHFPEHTYTQEDCLIALKKAPFWDTLTRRSHRIIDKVFSLDSGILKRHFCLDDLSSIWGKDASQLNQYYEASAPPLAASAVEKALSKANLTAQDIDVLLVSSCTGYLCPGLSSYIAERLGCKSSVHTQDLTGHGCGAAIPLQQIAQGYTMSKPGAVVATVAVEVCSAAFYISDEVDVLISNCLFGDGAAACLWSDNGGTHIASDFHSLLIPEEREKVRFVNSGGKLKNQLDKTVPNITARAAKTLYEKSNKPEKIITHGGGRDVISALEAALPVETIPETRHILENYGNLSSPSVFAALEHHLNKGESASHLWLCTFGAGFSAHSMELRKV
mgnify:CR=1 FL=1